MSAFTDDDLAYAKKCVAVRDHISIELTVALIARLEAAEKVCDEGESVAYSNAITVGTKTNSEMPKWFLLRVEDLTKALEAWHKAAGK